MNFSVAVEMHDARNRQILSINYRKIPRITPPFDAQKLMPKMGGGLIHEDLTFYIEE